MTTCVPATLTERSLTGIDIGELSSRAFGRTPSSTNDQWSLRHTSTFRILGRHVLNVWRIMRAELELGMYTLENTVFHLLRRRYEVPASGAVFLTLSRIPKYSPSTLTEWYNSPVPAHKARLLHHLLGHTTLVVEMLEATDVIAKTS
jgi:DNA polymerase zeta